MSFRLLWAIVALVISGAAFADCSPLPSEPLGELQARPARRPAGSVPRTSETKDLSATAGTGA
jgi:hypothetical protein